MIDMDSCSTFDELWSARVRNTPEHTFLVFEDNNGAVSEFSYGEFDNKVQQACWWFSLCGIEKGDRVLIASRNCPEVLVARFALGRLGAILASINPCSSLDDIACFMQICNPKMFLCMVEMPEESQGALRERHPGIKMFFGDTALNLFNDCEPKHVAELPFVQIDSFDTLEIVFTSGSTSRPKGVAVTNSNAVHASKINAMAFSIRQDDRFMVAVPLFHVDASYGAVASCILVGATVVLMEKYSASRYISQCVKHNATITHCVAMMIKTMLAQPEGANDAAHNLRQVSFFMALSDEERNEFSRRFGVRLINTYGLSESITSVAMDKLTGPIDFDAVGTPIYPFQIKIVDECGVEKTQGETGEVWVRGVPGETIMKGYYGNRPATIDAIVGGEWLRTGDLAFADARGGIHFVDRIKNIIKCKGENISAAEIERCLKSLLGVRDVAVVGAKDDICGERVVAVIVPDWSVPISGEDIRRHCLENLAEFKVPSEFRFVEELPSTATGKVDRKALRSQIEARN